MKKNRSSKRLKGTDNKMKTRAVHHMLAKFNLHDHEKDEGYQRKLRRKESEENDVYGD